jgi:hypothetical protein
MINAYAFLEGVLEVARSRKTEENLADLLSDSEGLTAVARRGFEAYSASASWNDDCEQFIRDAAEQEYNLDNLADYEELAPAVCYFALYALGAAVAKYLEGEMDERDFSLVRGVLAGFLLNESFRIRAELDQ